MANLSSSLHAFIRWIDKSLPSYGQGNEKTFFEINFLSIHFDIVQPDNDWKLHIEICLWIRTRFIAPSAPEIE